MRPVKVNGAQKYESKGRLAGALSASVDRTYSLAADLEAVGTGELSWLERCLLEIA
jgi:hypothetical protein